MQLERQKQLFAAACELPVEQRAAFLARECAGDVGSRARLERLLAAHARADDFLRHPTALVARVAQDLAREQQDGLAAGERVDDYELIERLGSGGFGSVWKARQLAPVQRDVALKIRHAGDDSAASLARFLAEQQALARLQHPGIAKVFDAGRTASGRPWLAMELVEGEPITTYCRGRRTSLARRLRLFVQVCSAVQHAHGKGLVHLDLKPANVLVTQRDGEDCPVVIDFGLARAAGERAAGDGFVSGTPDYMSPEQVDDVGAADTRTDVHALGLLLYELACWRRPFGERSHGGGLAGLLAEVRTTVPEAPSRRTRERLPRDLDWIVACALAKDPSQRYATVNDLAEEVRRLLRHEPVRAAPPARLHALRCFVRRHRLAVAAAVGMFASAATGLVVAIDGWQQAEIAEAMARADQRRSEQALRQADRSLQLFEDMWGAVDSSRLARADCTVRELLDQCAAELPRRAADEPMVELRVQRLMARLRAFVGAYPEAVRHAQRAVELAEAHGSPADRALALLQRAEVQFAIGGVAIAVADAREVVGLPWGGVADADVHVASAEVMLANCAWRAGDHDGAMAHAAQALQLRERIGDEGPVLASLRQIGMLHLSLGRPERAAGYAERAAALVEGRDLDDPAVITALQHRAFLRQQSGDLAGAEADFRDNLARRLRVYGANHPMVAWAKVDLGWLLFCRERPEEALPLLQEALPVLEANLEPGHYYISETLQRIGSVLIQLSRVAEAEPHLRRAAERFRTLPGHSFDGYVNCLGRLALLTWHRGERAAARAELQHAVDRLCAVAPADHFLVSSMFTMQADLAEADGDLAAAEDLLRDAMARSAPAGRHGEHALQRGRLVRVLQALGRLEEADYLQREASTDPIVGPQAEAAADGAK